MTQTRRMHHWGKRDLWLQFVCLFVLVCGSTLLLLPSRLSGTDRQVMVNPGDDIQAMVQKSPPGTTFRLKAGV